MRAPDERARHRRIEGLFEAALEMPEEGRDGFVKRECAGDGTLAAEVVRLLRAHGRSSGILDGDGPGARLRDAENPDSPVRRETEPERYGPYRVLHTLGRGGMGTVHLAVGEDAFMRRVALKVIHGRTRGGEALRRLESERRIMASLSHPNIAQLLDGGVTDDGIPYLAMEYVEGLPITTYCDRERLGVAERISLFRKVCDAVHHAHQNLNHPPGPEAVEHPRHGGRRAQAPRLRDRQASAGGRGWHRSAGDPSRPQGPDPGLRQPGAATG